MDSVLEGVMQTELDLSWRRAYSANLTEIAVGYPVVGISVAGDVKDVEEIGAEANYLFAPHVKVLEQRSIDLSVARGTLGVDGRSAERRQPAIVSDAIGTGSILQRRRPLPNSRRCRKSFRGRRATRRRRRSSSCGGYPCRQDHSRRGHYSHPGRIRRNRWYWEHHSYQQSWSGILRSYS